MALWEKTLAADHPFLAFGCVALGNVYRDRGRPAAAEPLYRRALAIREASHGADHPYVQEVVEAYGELLRAEGREAEAKELEGLERHDMITAEDDGGVRRWGCTVELMRRWLSQQSEKQ